MSSLSMYSGSFLHIYYGDIVCSEMEVKLLKETDPTSDLSSS